jgi:hypothetical protein
MGLAGARANATGKRLADGVCGHCEVRNFWPGLVETMDLFRLFSSYMVPSRLPEQPGPYRRTDARDPGRFCSKPTWCRLPAMPRRVREVIGLHSVWLLIVPVLLAVAERRIATHSHWPTAELTVEDAGAMKGERVFQALLLVDDAKPPEVGVCGCWTLLPPSCPRPRSSAWRCARLPSRSPPWMSAAQPTTISLYRRTT